MFKIATYLYSLVDKFTGYYESIFNRDANKDGYFLLLLSNLLIMLVGGLLIYHHVILWGIVLFFFSGKQFISLWNSSYIVNNNAYKLFYRQVGYYITILKLVFIVMFNIITVYQTLNHQFSIEIDIPSIIGFNLDFIGFLFLLANAEPPMKKQVYSFA